MCLAFSSFLNIFVIFVFSLLYSVSVHLASKYSKKYDFSASLFTSVNSQMKRCTTIVDALLRRWHEMLDLSRQSLSFWYRDRLLKKLRERRIAISLWQKLSETSDVLFFISRAQYDEFSIRKLSLFVATSHVLVYVYMLTKFTLRWNFFRTAAIICNASHYNLMREVVNSKKDQKLEEVALRHQIDPMKFKKVSCLLRQVWSLLS